MKVFTFDVDEEFARQHNEIISDSRFFRAGGIGLGIITMLVGLYVYFFPAERLPWGMMVLITTIVLGLAFIAIGINVGKNNKVQDMYNRYPLVPAVIAGTERDKYILLALVNKNVDPDLPPNWALAARLIKGLPGHTELKIGTKVPCAAVLGRRTSRDKDHWQEVIPMPIAWGTPDQEIIKTARKSIPHEYWVKLDKNRNKVDEVLKTSYNLLEI